MTPTPGTWFAMAMAAYNLKAEAFKAEHPGYCRKCRGWGRIGYTYDPSPAGVSLSGGTMTDEEPCPECVEKGKCPQCGGELDPEGVVCLAGCGWTYEAGEGLPEVPEGPDPDDDCFLSMRTAWEWE